jgi:hypothetical protein
MAEPSAQVLAGTGNTVYRASMDHTNHPVTVAGHTVHDVRLWHALQLAISRTRAKQTHWTLSSAGYDMRTRELR